MKKCVEIQEVKEEWNNFYSTLNDSTGSFLLAILAGIKPAIIVKTTLITTNIVPPTQGKLLIPLTPAIACIIRFIGIFNNNVIPIPSNPATKPIIKVSALNTLEISFLEAPIALKIPISFVLSSTDIYVIIPIMMLETTNDIDTNAIST